MTPHDNEERTTDESSSRSHDLLASMAGGRFQFIDSSRQTQINIALQLLRVNNRVLVVRGASGMGKTGLLTILLQRQPEGLHMVRVTAQPDTTLQQLVDTLMPMATRPAAAPLELLRDLAEQAVQPALLIDDADQLTDKVLAALTELWQTGRSNSAPLGLVLTSADNLNVRLAKVLHPDWVHSINLYPFSEKQTIDYVTQRLEAAGLLAMNLVSPTEMRSIHTQAEGVPARVDQEMRRLLNSRIGKDDGAARTGAATGGRVTRAAIAAALLLAAALIGALFYSDHWQPAPQQTVADAPPTPVSEVTRPGPVPNPSPIAGAEPERRTAPAPEQLVEPKQETESDSTRAQVPAGVPAEPRSDDATVQPEASALQVQPEASAPVEASSQEQPDAAVAAAPPLDASPVTPAQEAAPDASRATEPLPGNEWLRSRSPSRYTIQLIAARDLDAMRNFMQAHGIEDRAALLAVRRDEHVGYVVVYGDFPNWSRANTALNGMPKALRGGGAWVRRFGDLQKLAVN